MYKYYSYNEDVNIYIIIKTDSANGNPMPQVLLARHKENELYYAVKVLQKKIIMKKKEVRPNAMFTLRWKQFLTSIITFTLKNVFQQKHIMAERSVLMKNIKHPFLVGLHYSFQTTDKLYFVLDYVNGGEVCKHSIHIPM